MLRQFVAKIAPVLSAEKKPAQVQAIASGTASCARQARNALKPEEVQQLVELVLRLVQASFERCPAVKKDDEDDQAEADEERQSEEDARLALSAQPCPPASTAILDQETPRPRESGDSRT